MVQKGTYLIPVDKNGVWSVRVFHLYGGFYKKCSIFGSFLKISVRKSRPSSSVLKKSKLKSILISTSKSQIKFDGSFLRFKYNSTVLLKRRLTPVGKEIIGPCNFNLFRRRFVFSFSGVI